MKTKKHLFLTGKLILTFLVMLSTQVWGQGQPFPLSGEGTLANPYLINNKADWEALAAYVAIKATPSHDCSGKIFRLEDNIGSEREPVTRPLGQQIGSNKLTDRMRFAGIILGNGKTLTVNINSADEWFYYNKGYCAPIAYAQGVTISNLHVTGTITTTGQFASGLVGQSGPDNKPAQGACTISNCHVSITFNGNTNASSNGNHGTFIAIAEGNATINDCWFDGKLMGSNYRYSGGFIGLNKATASFNNCLFNPSEISITNNNILGSSEFVHENGGNHTLNRCYYTKSFSAPEDAQGTKVFATYNSEEFIVSEVTGLPDGNTYYIILSNINWTNIQRAINEGTTTTIRLPKDVTAGTDDKALVVSEGKTVSLDLKGFTLDRGLDIAAAENDGYVIKVENGGSLTLSNSTSGTSGTIKGGHNTGNGGCIFNEGTLIINGANGVNITSNFADRGAGIYVNKGEVSLTSVTISGNRTSTKSGSSGSGIFLNEGTLTLNGGTIKNNNSNKSKDSYGVGVYVKQGTFNVTGNVQINNNKCSKRNTLQNVYLNEGQVINITGNNINKSSIGVSIEGHEGAITSGLSGKGTWERFSSDNDSYYLDIDRSGEAWLKDQVVVHINGYGDYGNNNWAYIAQPFKQKVTPSSIENLLEANGNYDLYRINQRAKDAYAWENYKAHPDMVLANGQGYLYANKNDINLTFKGTFNTGKTLEVGLDYVMESNLCGWNLVGNPFPVTAKVDKNYYVMNEEGNGLNPQEVSANGFIAPGTGIVVKATSTGQKVKFTRDPGKTPTSLTKGRLQIALTQSNNRSNHHLDNAIVSFSEGSFLEKFYFGEQNANIYIPQDNEEYAIVSSEQQGEMPLNFRAVQDGSYTISINPENAEMEYLHLIDKKTGTEVDLLQSPEYSFNATATDGESRFRLVFNTVGNGDPSTSYEPFAYYADGEIRLFVEAQASSIFQVIDLMGRLLRSEAAKPCVSTVGMTAGVYVIRLIEDNNVKTQKIVVR